MHRHCVPRCLSHSSHLIGVCFFAGGAAGAGCAVPRCHFAGRMCWSPAGFSHPMGSRHAQQGEKLAYDLQTMKAGGVMVEGDWGSSECQH